MKDDQIVHNFNGPSSADKVKKQPMKINKSTLILFLVLALLGVGTGYIVAGTKNSNVITVGSKEDIQEAGVTKGQVFGSKDEKTFKDSAEGVMREGGIEGEGAYHLERPGGESQNVYMTSSVIDLSVFVGKKVKVWGKTFEAEKAGWLMDVGRLEVL